MVEESVVLVFDSTGCFQSKSQGLKQRAIPWCNRHLPIFVFNFNRYRVGIGFLLLQSNKYYVKPGRT